MIPALAAVVGATVGSGSQGTPLPRSVGWPVLVIALGLVAAGAAEPVIGVFALLVAANLTLGRTEWPPLSAYPMFSRPKPRDWSLQVEDEAGSLVAVATLGLDPVASRKQFATRAREARSAGAPDATAARRVAAAAFAESLEAHRPPRGPLATDTLTVCVVDYWLEAGHVHRLRTPLVETTP